MIKRHKRDKKSWDESSAERNFQLDGGDSIWTGLKRYIEFHLVELALKISSILWRKESQEQGQKREAMLRLLREGQLDWEAMILSGELGEETG